MAAFLQLPPVNLEQRKGLSLANVSSTEHDGNEWAFSATVTEISHGSAKPYVHAVCESGRSRKTYKPVSGMIK